MSAYIVLPEDIDGDVAFLRGDEHRHLTTSARVRVGESLRLTDGRGTIYDGLVDAVTASEARVRIVARTTRERESPVAATLAVALLKGRKMEWVLQKATELGADAIWPVISERSVPRKQADPAERHEAILRAATKQSERAWLPALRPLADLAAVLADAGSFPLRLLFHERAAGMDWDRIASTDAKEVLLLVGPEGGFSDREADAARAAGFIAVGLGPRILRGETAALAALALVQHRLGDLR